MLPLLLLSDGMRAVRRSLSITNEPGDGSDTCGCWNSRNCDLSGEPTFDLQVDSTDEPSRFAGILDLSDPRNPVHDHTVVFVPYCKHLDGHDDPGLTNRVINYSIPTLP